MPGSAFEIGAVGVGWRDTVGRHKLSDETGSSPYRTLLKRNAGKCPRARTRVAKYSRTVSTVAMLSAGAIIVSRKYSHVAGKSARFIAAADACSVSSAP